MPKITVSFSVEHVPQPTESAVDCVYIRDLRAFWEIEALGFLEIRGLPRNAPRGRLAIEANQDDPRIAAALAILQRSGHVPVEHLIVPRKQRAHGFVVTRTRQYDERELDQYEFLSLDARFCKDVIADWEGGSDDDGWIVKSNARLKKKIHIGHFDCPGISF